MPFCKYCGAKNDADANFCTECGKRIKIHTPPKATKTEKIQTPVATSNRTTTPVNKPQTPAHSEIVMRHWTEEEERAFNERRMNYTLSMAVFTAAMKQQNGGNLSSIDLDLWHEMERILAEKYGFGENSIFRISEPSILVDDSSPQNEKPSHRRIRSYNKKDTEYWSQFKAYKEDEE